MTRTVKAKNPDCIIEKIEEEPPHTLYYLTCLYGKEKVVRMRKVR